MTRCLVALGGNLGDVAGTFAAALDLLANQSDIDVIAVSRCFVTEPVGTNAGDAYLNAATVLETSRTPAGLLEATKSVEVDLGRARHHANWTPRTVDLDLVTCGDTVLMDGNLRVPHPGCWYRRFVLDPLCRIAGSTRHPSRGLTFEELRQRLLVRPLPVWLELEDRDEKIAKLESRFPEIEWVRGPEDVVASGLDLPGTPAPPDSLADILAAATGSVELAGEIPGWPETAAGETRSGA